MIRTRHALLAIALGMGGALVAPAVQAADKAHPAWLIGDWGDVTSDFPNKPECGDHDIAYDGRGHYTIIDDAGTWQLHGDRLCTRKLIEYDYDRKKWRNARERESCQTVRRRGRLVESRFDGRWMAMGRCGPHGIDATTARKVDAAERERLAKARN